MGPETGSAGGDQALPNSSTEWLEPDGLGAYASGTVGLVRTRRYHALLMVAVRPPTLRFVLVNGIEAWLEREGQPDVPLSAQRYLPDVLWPDGFAQVTCFSANPFPCWSFALPEGGVVRFEVFASPDAAGTVLRWTAPAGCPWLLRVRPLLSGREQNALHRENPGFRFAPAVCLGNVCWRPYDGVPAISALTNGAYTHAPEWYRNFTYAQERLRGLDDGEDLAAPGVFAFPLAADPAVMILRAGDGLSLRPAECAEALADRARARRGAQGALDRAAAAYLVDRGSGRTIIAGYPWFTDWGRDTFISLRGLCLATGRLRDARDILLQWAGSVDGGMVPNRFPDDGGPAEFNSVDAALWFVIAAHDYLTAAPPDDGAAAVLGAAVGSILRCYRDGTRHRIGMDADGLIAAGEPGVQLTWMDAKYDGHVVTPRIGKPVEIAALWINALRIGARWSADWTALADRATQSFLRRFPNPQGGLYDVVDAGHVAGTADASIRPNQIFAVGGLPFPVLDGAAAGSVLDTVETHLLTPVGLRSLAPSDPAYCPRYQGGRVERDSAYHQGTVWPFLLGPFVDAWLRQRGRTDAARAEAARRFLAPLEAERQRFGLGHLPEVADGDAPHTPGGCPFQAWSMGEYLRLREWCRGG
jgi:predicted glycogen debranching enzyme